MKKSDIIYPKNHRFSSTMNNHALSMIRKQQVEDIYIATAIICGVDNPPEIDFIALGSSLPPHYNYATNKIYLSLNYFCSEKLDSLLDTDERTAIFAASVHELTHYLKHSKHSGRHNLNKYSILSNLGKYSMGYLLPIAYTLNIISAGVSNNLIAHIAILYGMAASNLLMRTTYRLREFEAYAGQSEIVGADITEKIYCDQVVGESEHKLNDIITSYIDLTANYPSPQRLSKYIRSHLSNVASGRKQPIFPDKKSYAEIESFRRSNNMEVTR